MFTRYIYIYIYDIHTACARALLNDVASGPVPEEDSNVTNLTQYFLMIRRVNLRSGWVLDLLEAAGKNVRHNAGRNLEPWRRMNSAQSVSAQ